MLRKKFKLVDYAAEIVKDYKILKRCFYHVGYFECNGYCAKKKYWTVELKCYLKHSALMNDMINNAQTMPSTKRGNQTSTN